MFLKKNDLEKDFGTQLKMWKCNECNKTFTSKSGFGMHIQHHTGKYSHFCSICRKGYNNGYHFKLHMRGHEGKGFPCEYCGKVFKKIQSKKYPESEHTGVYRFTCTVCSKGFNDKGVFVKHEARHM